MDHISAGLSHSRWIATILVLSTSCALTCFQTPEVIPPGHAGVGVGGAVGVYPGGAELEGESFGPWFIPELDVWGRFGLGRRVDVGLKASATRGYDAILADVKFQTSEGDVKSSIGLGLLGFGHLLVRSPEFEGVAFVPTALTGRRRFYCGLRVPIVLGYEDSFLSISNFSIPLGLKLGGPKFMTMLEADVHLPYPVLCLGLGFQYAF